MANGHGGKRPGGGRKPNAEKHKKAVAGFTDLAAGHLLEAFDLLWTLAGGANRVQRTRVAAGTLLRRDVVRNADGSVHLDGKGKTSVAFVRANDLPAAELVVVKEVTTEEPPDFRALELIVDRVMGTPRPSPEEAAEILEIRWALKAAVEAAAARKARPTPSDEPPPTPPVPDDDEPE